MASSKLASVTSLAVAPRLARPRAAPFLRSISCVANSRHGRQRSDRVLAATREATVLSPRSFPVHRPQALHLQSLDESQLLDSTEVVRSFQDLDTQPKPAASDSQLSSDSNGAVSASESQADCLDEDVAVSELTLGQASPADEARDLTRREGWWSLLQQAAGPLLPGPKTRGLLLLNLLVLLVATNWVVLKESGEATDPLTFAFLRFAVAAGAFLPFLRSALKKPNVVRAGLELGAWTSIGYLSQSVGLESTDASRASFISTFTVLVVPLLVGFSGQGVKWLTWATAAAALCGVGLLEQGGSPPCIGDLWSALSAVAFGVQVFRTEHYSKTLEEKSALQLMSIIMAVTAVLSGAATVAAHPHETQQLLAHITSFPAILASSLLPWKEILYTGLLSTDLALLIEVIALHDVQSTDAAIIYTMEPVLGAGFAWMMLGERWGPSGWVGAALIVSSSLAAQIFGTTEDLPQAEAATSSVDVDAAGSVDEGLK